VRIVLKTCGVFLRSVASSFEDEDVIVTKPSLAVGPTRLRVRLRAERANPPARVAEETPHQRLPLQL